MSRWSRRIPGPNMRLEIDMSQIEIVMDELRNTPSEVGKATSRALRRTATALRKLASKRLTSELHLRRAMELRRRLKTMKIRAKDATGEKVIGLWFGLDPLAVSRFKYKPGPKEYSAGATFRGQEFPGAFVAKMPKKTRASIYRRSGRGRFPLVEEKLPIQDIAEPIIEDEIFPQATEIFLKKLMHELKWQASQRDKKPG